MIKAIKKNQIVFSKRNNVKINKFFIKKKASSNQIQLKKVKKMMNKVKIMNQMMRFKTNLARIIMKMIKIVKI